MAIIAHIIASDADNSANVEGNTSGTVPWGTTSWKSNSSWCCRESGLYAFVSPTTIWMWNGKATMQRYRWCHAEETSARVSDVEYTFDVGAVLDSSWEVQVYKGEE